MTDKELQKLKREDLLQILIGQQRQIQELTESLEKAQAELANRRVKLENVGSIAEAALQLNGVFEAAQRAADDYLAQAKERADEIVRQAQHPAAVETKAEAPDEAETERAGRMSRLGRGRRA